MRTLLQLIIIVMIGQDSELIGMPSLGPLVMVELENVRMVMEL